MNAKLKVPVLLVEQLALGELDPETAAEVRDRLAAEPGGFERLEQIEQSNDDILEQYPAAAVVTDIRRRAERVPATEGRPRRWPFYVAIPSLATAAAAAVLLIVFWDDPGGEVRPGGGEASPQQDEVILIKGDPWLKVYRKTSAGGTGSQGLEEGEQLAGGTAVRPGDVLQLKYKANDAVHGVVISIDGAGAVTLHFPETRDESTALDRGDARALPYSYELDDAPAFERFVFVTASSPIDVESVIDAAKVLGADSKRRLSLSDDYRQFDIVLRKTSQEQ